MIKKCEKAFCTIFLLLVLSGLPLKTHAQFSENGYPEHFAGGVIIGGSVSLLILKKTDNKITSCLAGLAAAGTAGFLKEVIDPLFFDTPPNMTDAAYTVLGGAVGASIIIPLNTKRRARKSSLSLMVRPFSTGLAWRPASVP